MKTWPQTCDQSSQPGFHRRVVCALLWVFLLICGHGGVRLVVAQEASTEKLPKPGVSRLWDRPQSKQTIYQPPVHQVPNRQIPLRPAPGRRSTLRQMTQEPKGTRGESGPILSAPRNGPLDFEADRQISDGYSDDPESGGQPAIEQMDGSQAGPEQAGPEQVESESGNEETLEGVEEALPFQAIPRIGPEPLEPADSWKSPVEDLAEPMNRRVLPPNRDVGAGASGGVLGLFGPRQAPIPPDYWIISSRDCPQEKSPCAADRCTRYYYRGPSGKIELRTAADFHRSLNPAIPVCFMIHGSLIEWEQNVQEGHATYAWLKRAAPNTRFQMVLFTWPSEKTLILPQIDFSVLGYRSSYNGLYLARVLARMPATASVSLIGHSHGARLAVSALHLLGGGEAYGYRLAAQNAPLPRIRTVLAAAAMDHHWMDPGQRYGMALNATESLLNMKNQTDIPLILYPFPLLLGHDSLGRGGFSWLDQYRLGDKFDKVRNVDVTFMLGLGHIWPRFHDHVEIAEKLTPYLFYQKDVPPHSLVTRRWKSNWTASGAEESRATVVTQPASRDVTGHSTLVRNTTRSTGSRSSVNRSVAIPLEPGRASLNAPAVKRYSPPRIQPSPR